MKKLLILSTVLVYLAGCTPLVYNTYSQQAAEKDLSDYKTFAWQPRDSAAIQDILYDSEFISEKIKRSAISHLKNRGYRYSSKNPDLLVRYRLIIEEEERIISTPIYAPAPVNPYYQTFPYNRMYPYDNTFNYNYSFYNNLYNHQYNFNPYFTPPYQYQFQPHWGGGIYATTPVVTGSNFHEVEFDTGTLVIDIIDAKTNELLWRGWSEGDVDHPKFFETEVDNIVGYIFNEYPVKSQPEARY